MSVQSESGRKDYHNSDHAPKGTRMSGDVLPFKKAFSGEAASGRLQNKVSDLDAKEGLKLPDTTNIELFPKERMKESY